MLVRGLPDSAASKQEGDPEVAQWGLLEELTAQVVEEISVLAAEQRRKEPRSIPRPWEPKGDKKSAGGINVSDDGAIQATGLAGMLSATQMRGAVNLGG